MATISKPVGRGDFLLHAGADERVGVLWERDRLDGEGYTPVDLSSWDATLELECDGEVVYSAACDTTGDGYAMAMVDGMTLSGLYTSARSGSWRIVATDGSERDMLGYGYYEIVR